MQLYLFEYLDALPQFDYLGDDAATVWHEYTHGLSNRLVVDEDGVGALNSAHAGAMGEAWSDWYAEDLLTREGLETDDPDVSGDIDLGEPSDAGAAHHAHRGDRLPGRQRLLRPGHGLPRRREHRPRRLHARRLRRRSPAAPRSTPTARSGSRRCGTCARASSTRSAARPTAPTPPSC